MNIHQGQMKSNRKIEIKLLRCHFNSFTRILFEYLILLSWNTVGIFFVCFFNLNAPESLR